MNETSHRTGLLASFGAVKPVRYLVTSVAEFQEIVTTTNLIFTKAGTLEQIEALERRSLFSVIPLPESFTRFIACFAVPSVLLGDDHGRDTLRIDFGDVELSPDRFHHDCANGDVKLCYRVDTLFEANLALAHFERLVAGIPANGNRLALRRSLRLYVYPPAGPPTGNRLEFLVPALSPEQLARLKLHVSSS